MKKNWLLLASILFLPALPLMAQEADLQDMDTDETAYVHRDNNCEERCPPRCPPKCPPKCPPRCPPKCPPCVDKCCPPEEVCIPRKDCPEEVMIRTLPVITPSVAPHIAGCGTDTFVTLDFIWWKTFISGMEYAYGGVSDNGFAVTPLGTSTKEGHAHYPDFEFEPGVKVGVGTNFEHDGWDLYAQWTWLSSGGSDSSVSVAAGSGAGLSSIQDVIYNNGSIGTIDLASAHNDFDQDFNVIDLELGRDFFLSRYLTMRPHFGLKTAWIHESTKTTLIPTSTVPLDNGRLPSAATLSNSEHMWGIGIRTGFDTGWHFTRNWMIYGDLALTNLWGRFNNHARGTITEPSLGTVTTEHSEESFQTLIPVVEMGLGISYISWFQCKQYRFEVRLGWEEQIWIDYNRSFQDYYRSGNLTVHGATLKTQLNF